MLQASFRPNTTNAGGNACVGVFISFLLKSPTAKLTVQREFPNTISNLPLFSMLFMPFQTM